MKVRGQRECTQCGTRWSYYDTGSVACPECDSLRSVGVDDDRARHTDLPADIDLSPYRSAIADDEVAEVAGEMSEDLRAYVRKRGFIDGGDLRPLDDDYLLALELRYVLDDLSRDRRVGVDAAHRGDEAGELYLLTLVRALDGDADRPGPDEVPDTASTDRGLACATAVLTYREEVLTVLDDRASDGGTDGDGDADIRRLLGRLRDRAKRVRALDGDVPPAEAETLVRVARDVHDAVGGDETALARAGDRLDRLD